jgi:hypothetical protein
MNNKNRNPLDLFYTTKQNKQHMYDQENFKSDDFKTDKDIEQNYVHPRINIEEERSLENEIWWKRTALIVGIVCGIIVLIILLTA